MMTNLHARIDNRQDGYIVSQVNAVCTFQADVETGKFGKVNYEALRTVLSAARQNNNLNHRDLVSLYLNIA